MEQVLWQPGHRRDYILLFPYANVTSTVKTPLLQGKSEPRNTQNMLSAPIARSLQYTAQEGEYIARCISFCGLTQWQSFDLGPALPLFLVQVSLLSRICQTHGTAEQRTHLSASHSKNQKGPHSDLLHRSYVLGPSLALNPKAKQFATACRALVLVRVSTAPSPLTHGNTKMPFLPDSFQSLNLPPSLIPLFPPSISKGWCYQEGPNLLPFASQTSFRC